MAIKLDQNNFNVYFNKSLALYSMGKINETI